MAAKDDDIGSTEYWSDIKQGRQEKRADNRKNSAKYLADRGIPFISKNGGAHLIVEGNDCFIDYWPGTGKWNSRCGKKGFGVRNLVAFIELPSNAAEPRRPLDIPDELREQPDMQGFLRKIGDTE